MPIGSRFSPFRRSDPVGYRKRYDSCLDQIEENYNEDICQNKHGSKSSKRRSTMMSGSRSSLMDINKSNVSGSKRFMSFIHKGLNGGKSKSIPKIDSSNFQKICNERKNCDILNDIVPIPIRETAIQGHSKTLFHKIPKSNVRPKPLLKLDDNTKFFPIHPSLLNQNFNYCVKIISLYPNTYRKCSSANNYELQLPTGTRSLGHTCRIKASDNLQDQCPSCNSSQLSLFDKEEKQKQMTGYVFSCTSEQERQRWISVLTRVAKPNQQHDRRREISLHLWIQEAKNVLSKKRYFCEIYLDKKMHAKTTVKVMTDMLFWGEEFHLCNLNEVKIVTILLWKVSSDNRMKKKPHQQLICQVNIDTNDIEHKNSVEKWYSASYDFSFNANDSNFPHEKSNTISSSHTILTPVSHSLQTSHFSHGSSHPISSEHFPMIRIKARYQNLVVLPINDYLKLNEFLKENALSLVREIESFLKVKHKEDLSQNLIKIIHKQGTAAEFLCDLILHEINKSDDQNMILRGNTMASKAIEVYLKLVGGKYLNLTLSDFVNRVLKGDDDCEVDPQKDNVDLVVLTTNNGFHNNEKSNSQYTLRQRQESLLMNVDMVWAKIMSSSIYFPKDLKSVFITLRMRMDKVNKNMMNKIPNNEPNLCDRIVSACIFLRYICPAILTPSLFGLIPEYPDNPKVTRTFTLVAKCIQTLANFSDLTGCKESYMVFMNSFIENKFETMHAFLKEISTESPEQNIKSKSRSVSLSDNENPNGQYWENLSNTLSEETIDLPLCLAKLHMQLEEYLKLIPAQKLSKRIEILYSIIEDINSKLHTKEMILGSTLLKNSQSYQDTNGIQKGHVKNESKYAENVYFASRNSDEILKSDPSNIKIHESYSAFHRPHIRKSSDISYSANTSPTHNILDTADSDSVFLMTQSVTENKFEHLNETECKAISQDQIDKEWKEMVSKSSFYNSPVELMINNNSEKNRFGNLNKDSSKYQMIPRTPCNGPSESTGSDKTPSLTSRSSVKRCKQIQKQTDLISSDEYSIHGSQQNHRSSRIHHPMKRCSSTERIKNKFDSDSQASPNEFMDTGSTETLTSSNQIQMTSSSQSQLRCFINCSTSMPSFNCPELAVEDPLRYRNQFLGHEKENNLSKMKTMSTYSTEIMDQVNQNTLFNAQPSRTESKVKQMKISLSNLHHALNIRMAQLLLTDHKTIELELERVRLMRNICELALNQNFNETNYSEPTGKNIKVPYQDVDTSAFKEINDLSAASQISVKKYLEVAENVLENTQQNILKGVNTQKDSEHFLMQIFRKNQSLQNILLNKMECLVSSSDPIPNNGIVSNKSHTNRNCQILPTFKSSVPNDISVINKNTKTPSLLNSSPATIIELIDAV